MLHHRTTNPAARAGHIADSIDHRGNFNFYEEWIETYSGALAEFVEKECGVIQSTLSLKPMVYWDQNSLDGLHP